MDFKRVYFIGIGGIGMSAIARFFMHEGLPVAGYDRVATPLTRELEAEGAAIHYDDSVGLIPVPFLDKASTLVVYTPAIPSDHSEYLYFVDKGFEIVKRSAMLGVIARGKYVMAIAGTHGKTTTTTMTAWFNHVAGGGGSAFLGGISKNFDTNLVLGKGDRLSVEADEYDRSFLQLYPDVAVITAADADHLDIYGTHEAVKEAFEKFISQIKPGGAVIIKCDTPLRIPNPHIRAFSYALDDNRGDFFAENIELQEGGYYKFDIVCPDRTIKGCTLGIPGRVNIENCIAAVALLWVAGFDEEKLKEAIASFRGVKRRFDFYLNTPGHIYMDDYAHHPEELKAAISSVRAMFPDRKLTAIFQPHLYTRTADFYKEFAEALSLAHEAWLLPIYPAREEPIEGVDSQMILREMTVPGKIVEKADLLNTIENENPELLVTFGAGDIDNFCGKIAELLERLPAGKN